MESLRQDLRFTLRSLRRAPGFTVTAIAILAIGIGMSVAMFTIFNTVLVARLPVADQDRVAVLWTYRARGTELSCPVSCLDEVRRRSTTMQDIAPVIHWFSTPRAFQDADRHLSLAFTLVGTNLFQVLGARAFLGRLFIPGQDDAPLFERPPIDPTPLTAVLSYRAWKRDFGGDSSVIGKRIVESLFNQPYTIIGVLPPGLEYPSSAEIWVPMTGGWKSGFSAIAVGRLKPAATLSGARDEFTNLINAAEPLMKVVGTHAETFGDTMVGATKPIIVVLTAAVLLLLLITCLNVGNLLLLRASARMRELGLRRVLGATYADLVRQLVLEASLLAITGGVLGLTLALSLLAAARRLAPQTLPRVDELTGFALPLALAAITTLAAVALFGVVPSLFIARSHGGVVLRIDTRTGNETRRRRTLRQSLVATQVALAMVTLGGAGLLAKSLERLERQDAGYDAEHLAIAEITWDITRVNSAPTMSALALRIEQNIVKVPGIIATTELVVPPLYGAGVWQIQVAKEGQTKAESQQNPTLNGEIVGPGFSKTLGTRVLRGRGFTADDRSTSAFVVLVSEAFAQRYWPGENPIGKRISFPAATDESLVGGSGLRTVVGVVEDNHLRSFKEATPMMYFPTAQGYWQGQFAIRTTVPLSQLRRTLDAAVRDAGGGAKVESLDAMDALLDVPLAAPRLSALLMSAFGFVALLLSAIGLYGVMASIVRDQTRDIGIRIALGATASRVRADVLRSAVMTLGIGALIGMVGVLAGSRSITALLFRVKPTDPVALAGAVIVLIGAGLVAAYIPARRATKIDPAQALRS